MTKMLAVTLAAAGALAVSAPPASAEQFCFQVDINACFDAYPEPVPSTWRTAVYVVCRIVSDGGGGC